MSDLARTLGNSIRPRRLKLGLTQEEMSARVGIHYTFLGHIERGNRLPSLETLARIAEVLKVPMHSLCRFKARR
ncbi:MAG TPA: XRE family transcriptional regulator [Elusimicrobia bacterium]|nr:XRE family transcriptional regulator [Elusimicrobiota bacterium]HBT60723.1 XRE family transcriptional regulator [Elusimicrobiota bacterium]